MSELPQFIQHIYPEKENTFGNTALDTPFAIIWIQNVFWQSFDSCGYIDVSIDNAWV